MKRVDTPAVASALSLETELEGDEGEPVAGEHGDVEREREPSSHGLGRHVPGGVEDASRNP